MEKEIKVNCPQCGKSVQWDKTNKARPFCSDRCKLLDLGDWANESHTIAGNDLEFDAFSNDLDPRQPQ